MSENNNSNHIYLNAAGLLALLTVVLVVLSWTDLGQVKAFRFATGEMAMITGAVFCFQATRVGKSATVGAACFLVVASLQFVQAVWFSR